MIDGWRMISEPVPEPPREPARDRPFGAAIDKIGTEEGADLLATHDGDTTRVSGQVGVDVGKGVSVGAGGYWQKTKDTAREWAVWAGLSWRPKN